MKIEKNRPDYLSILHKIINKPLIIEYIFSFLKNEPYKFFQIIEKDKNLKDLLNSRLSTIKKNNTLSKELNENIYLIQILKRFQRSLASDAGNKDLYIFKNETFEEKGVKDVIDPSFLVYQCKYYLDAYKDKIPISISCLIDIAFNEQEKNEIIKLVYLPDLNNKYIDGNYLYKNMSLNGIKDKDYSNKKIDTLFCIIDDNEYYNYHFSNFKKEIIINEVYFIYIEGNKKINLYDAIEKYLNLLNKNIINKITLGPGFFQKDQITDMPILKMIDYALINKKQFSVQSSTLINFNIEEDIKNYVLQKIYFGMYFLFEKAKIDGSFVLDFKTYKNNENSFKAIEEIKGKFLVIKIYDTSNLSDEKFVKISNDLINCDINFVICYLIENGKENKNNINKEIILPFNIKTRKEFLFYSEIPRKISYEINKETIYDYFYYEAFDCENNLIFYFQDDEYTEETPLFNYYFFLLEKYEKFCFKRYEYWENKDSPSHKFYFIKKKNTYKTYDLIICTTQKDEEFDLMKFFKMQALDIKIEKIKYQDFSFGWKNISKQNNNKKGKKGHKTNEKQIIDNELEEEIEEFIDDYEEDN